MGMPYENLGGLQPYKVLRGFPILGILNQEVRTNFNGTKLLIKEKFNRSNAQKFVLKIKQYINKAYEFITKAQERII